MQIFTSSEGVGGVETNPDISGSNGIDDLTKFGGFEAIVVFEGELRLGDGRGATMVFAQDFRYIDWNLYGRLDKLLLRLFEEEEDLHIYILVDVSDSMAIGNPLPKLHYAMQVGAALTYVGLANLDRVVVWSALLAATQRYARELAVEVTQGLGVERVRAAAIDEALDAKAKGEKRVILFNLSGHGHFDMGAYEAYLSGKLEDYEYPADAVQEAMKHLPQVQLA